MPVLGIDTATTRGSVALAREGRILAEAMLEERAGHARDLLARIDGILREIGAGPRDLTGIGVAVGPGSFTGVRVGMATAKGLAYALGIGLSGLSTLEALAWAACRAPAAPADGICAVLEAGRGEVYAAIFALEGGEPRRRTLDRSWRPVDLAGEVPAGFQLVGDGTRAVVQAARAAGRALDAAPAPPLLAPSIALWAVRTITPGSGYAPGTLGPNYVRPTDAEAARRRS